MNGSNNDFASFDKTDFLSYFADNNNFKYLRKNKHGPLFDNKLTSRCPR